MLMEFQNVPLFYFKRMKAWLNINVPFIYQKEKKKVKYVSLNENQPKLKVVSETGIQSVKKQKQRWMIWL